MPPQNILSRHFEKNICMVWCLNFQDMLETPFPFFLSKKPGEIPIFGTFLGEKIDFFFQFWSIFTDKPLFESGHV